MSPVSDAEILDRFRSVRCWTRGDQRAPHKPLLLLMALAQLQRGEDRWLSYEVLEPRLRDLLREFGPPRKSHHPEYSFWWLQSDGLWVIDHVDMLVSHRRGQQKEPTPTALRALHAKGSFPSELIEVLRNRPSIINEIAGAILEENFPRSLHDDILDAVGFPWVVAADRKRDPAFRELVLRIYEHRCAVCGYDGRLGASELGLEAAHVRWHAAGGPDSADNGIALCVLHHKAFDRGAIGLDEEHRVIISQDVHGSTSVEELLLRHSGQPLRGPQKGQAPPAVRHVRWHLREVFRAPARAI